MTMHISSQDEQAVDSTDMVEESAVTVPSQLAASPPFVLPSQPEAVAEEYFSFEEEQPGPGASFATPFQFSDAIPKVQAQAQLSGQADAIPLTPAMLTTKTSRRPRFSLMMVAILVCVVVIAGLFVSSVLAQTTPPLQARRSISSPMAQHVLPRSSGKQNVTPSPRLKAPPTTDANDWVPQQLPTGWTNAGLQTGDGIQAIRAGVAFTDREMSVDVQSIGTRAHHDGTLTSAMFILTAAAKQRFVQNDLREVNNSLFDLVVKTKLVRLVVNPQPHLVQFAQQDQQQFAWVDVAFQLWQSQINPNAPSSRIEGKELDPATKLPRIHHMTVLLLRVSVQDAGNTPAMGGIGWLVSNYALDLPKDAALNIVQPA